MPDLVPPERYDRVTPATADFYHHLAAGLALTLEAESAVRAALEDECTRFSNELAIAVAEMTQAQADAAAAEQVLRELPVRSGRRVGVGAAKAALREAKTRHEVAVASRDAATHELEVATRGVELRSGSAQPFHKLQQQHLTARVGLASCGVYALYDYDGHAMYVGKTTEGVATRVRRHLTNQRTDAVAMNVLDPLEVAEIEIWPIWSPSSSDKSDAAKRLRAHATEVVGALEWVIEQRCIAAGHKLFNEKRIPAPDGPAPRLPASIRFDALSEGYRRQLGHPDLRIARRSAVSARLAGKIAERDLATTGLRRSLQRQMGRLRELADARFRELGGDDAVADDDGDD